MVQPAQHRKTLQSTSCNCCWQGSVAFGNLVGFGEDQGTPQKKYDIPSRSSVLSPSLSVQVASHSAFDLLSLY